MMNKQSSFRHGHHFASEFARRAGIPPIFTFGTGYPVAPIVCIDKYLVLFNGLYSRFATIPVGERHQYIYFFRFNIPLTANFVYFS